jgi:hypothetical protein
VLDKLSIAVDSWIIQDGNYADFAVGDKAEFALEFAGSTLRPSASKETPARHLGHGVYEVCAQVLFVDASVWVIDFGLCAFWESKPPEHAKPGTWVEGELLVGIDPFFYMEYLHKLPGMPNLFYNWTVASIMRNDTPWLVEVNAYGGKMLSRDQTNEAWANVPRTDAWNDDEGRSSYVLTVERRDA